jgi:hypothetical protein
MYDPALVKVFLFLSSQFISTVLAQAFLLNGYAYVPSSNSISVYDLTTNPFIPQFVTSVQGTSLKWNFPLIYFYHNINMNI